MFGNFETPNKEFIVLIDKPSLNPLGVVQIITIFKLNPETKVYEAVIKMPLKPLPPK